MRLIYLVVFRDIFITEVRSADKKRCDALKICRTDEMRQKAASSFI